MKFIHTADWQMGMKALHVGGAAEHVREARLKSARNVMDAARENGVDFLLVAGDTFEDNGVDRLLVQKVADVLGSAPAPVFIMPGNHDPLAPGSVWEHPAWRSADRITVLREAQPQEIPGGVLYPCPVREKYSAKDPTAWIEAGDGEGIRIGMAHGTVEGIHQAEPEYPIPRDAAARAGLDYLALGHWHSYAPYPGADGAIRMAYSGTHETTKFGERDSGHALLVEITESGAAPAITPLTTGNLTWTVLECALMEHGDLAAVRQEIEDIDNAASTLIDLRIGGLYAASEINELSHIQEIVHSRFLFGQVEASGLLPQPDDDEWIDALPAGIIRETGMRLRELADQHYTDERPEGAAPEVASRALLELYAIVSETSQ